MGGTVADGRCRGKTGTIDRRLEPLRLLQAGRRPGRLLAADERRRRPRRRPPHPGRDGGPDRASAAAGSRAPMSASGADRERPPRRPSWPRSLVVASGAALRQPAKPPAPPPAALDTATATGDNLITDDFSSSASTSMPPAVPPERTRGDGVVRAPPRRLPVLRAGELLEGDRQHRDPADQGSVPCARASQSDHPPGRQRRRRPRPLRVLPASFPRSGRTSTARRAPRLLRRTADRAGRGHRRAARAGLEGPVPERRLGPFGFTNQGLCMRSTA